MKNIAIALCSLVCIATSTYAGVLPKGMEHLHNRKGVLITTHNGEVNPDQSNIECTVRPSDYDGVDGLESVMIDTKWVFTVVYFDDSSKGLKLDGDTLIYTASDYGKSEASSACGTQPLTSYKNTVTVTKDSISIREKYTCSVFKKHDYVRTCTLQ